MKHLPVDGCPENALVWQGRVLSNVAGTFARTLPQFPPPLRGAMSNAFLLLRIADTIEDDASLNPARKRAFLGEFVKVVEGQADARTLADQVLASLSDGTTEGERYLVANTETVVQIADGLPRFQRESIKRSARKTAAGMAEFCGTGLGGVDSTDALERYCHLMSGVSGETITELLCDYSPEIASRRELLLPLASEYGRGIQLANILRDRWDDRRRGVCWLPRDIFVDGTDPAATSPASFEEGVRVLLGIARYHLEGGLEFTLLIPPHETGVRRFLLWTLGIHLAFLLRIAKNPGFRNTAEIRLRRDAWATVIATTAAARSDRVLRWLFEAATRQLPAAREP